MAVPTLAVIIVAAVGAALAASPCAAQSAREPQFRAVVAGVTNYMGQLTPTKGEPFALGAGARAMKVALVAYAKRAGYTEKNIRIVVLVDDEKGKSPDRKNILDALSDLAYEASQPEDTFAFFFTGHGSRDAGGMVLYASGADEVRVTDRIELTYVSQMFETSHAGTKVVFIDACQTPRGRDRLTVGLPPLLERVALDNLKVQGTAWFFSSEPNDPAYVAKNGIGFFTNHLTRALTAEPEANIRYADQFQGHLRRVVSLAVAADKSQKRYQYPSAKLDGIAGRFDLFPLRPPEGAPKVILPTDRNDGLVLATDVKAGNAVHSGHFLSTPGTRGIDDGSRPFDVPRDIAGACFSRSIQKGKALVWDDIALCR